MSSRIRSGPSLAALSGVAPAYTAWLDGTNGVPPATAELSRIDGDAPASPAPWFASAGAEAWAAEHRTDMPAGDRQRFDEDLEALRRGLAAVVVTGQQPGFLGGPLLTVHKIATAVALAERLTASGRRTVPVFWSGDADDDLVEALEPVAWLPGEDRLVRSEGRVAARHGRLERRRLGALAADRWQAAAADWFAAVDPAKDDLGLGGCWRPGHGAADWASRQRRCLLQAFSGTGLMVVSGDDSRLHHAAREFYGGLSGRLEELAGYARDQGRELGVGGPGPISERSLARPLYRVDGPRRRAVAEPDGVEAADLRPGVMLRSPLQDWLLAPRAVVVGPGELAYLRQLEPVHAALGLERCPLVPRLSAWVVPSDLPDGALANHRRAAGVLDDDDRERIDTWLADLGDGLTELLAEVAHVPDLRARLLAESRTRRWARGVRSLLGGERARSRATGPRRPVWVFPDGRRQERTLAWGAILGLGGSDLRDLILETAHRHLDAGAQGDWLEWECIWDEPAT